jgi:hypothetical protein
VATPAERFEREHGCTEAEWLGWLPHAVHGHDLQRPTPARAVVPIGGGTLALDWTVLPPRRIALLNLPRLQVRYALDGVPDDERARFMKQFDLHLQRGGG